MYKDPYKLWPVSKVCFASRCNYVRCVNIHIVMYLHCMRDIPFKLKAKIVFSVFSVQLYRRREERTTCFPPVRAVANVLGPV